jgi:hypothetical protein
MAPSAFDALPDVDRHEMEAMHYLEASKCPCGCGQFMDDSMSRDWNWNVEHRKCFAGAALDQVRREFDKTHKDDPSRNDGRLWTVSPVAPD